MAHYAQINKEDNIVVQVFVGRDEDDLVEGVDSWEEYYATEGFFVKRTSYNTKGGIHYNQETNQPSDTQEKSFRKNYACVGYTYSFDLDAFIPPKPFDSWSFDEDSCLWMPPTPMPEDEEKIYIWSEGTQSWVRAEF